MSDTSTQINGAIDDLVHVGGDLQPVVADVVEIVADVQSGNEIGAVTKGISSIGDVTNLVNDAKPLVKEIEAAAGQVAHSGASITDIGNIVAHLVSGGVLGMIEHEVGPMADLVKGRLGAFLTGIFHAASTFAHKA